MKDFDIYFHSINGIKNVRYDIGRQRRHHNFEFGSMWTIYLCMNMLFKNYANTKRSFEVVLPSFIHCLGKIHAANIAKSIKKKSFLVPVFWKSFTWENFLISSLSYISIMMTIYCPYTNKMRTLHSDDLQRLFILQ